MTTVMQKHRNKIYARNRLTMHRQLGLCYRCKGSSEGRRTWCQKCSTFLVEKERERKKMRHTPSFEWIGNDIGTDGELHIKYMNRKTVIIVPSQWIGTQGFCLGIQKNISRWNAISGKLEAKSGRSIGVKSLLHDYQQLDQKKVNGNDSAKKLKMTRSESASKAGIARQCQRDERMIHAIETVVERVVRNVIIDILGGKSQ